MVEDSADDAELEALELRRSGFDVTYQRVDTAAALKAALDHKWDLILADYNLPGFTGIKALEMVQQSGLDIPFILVSGAIGEDAAVAAMRAGAHDYVMKDNLRRLPLAIARELREVEVRYQQKTEQEHRRFLAEAGAVLVGDLDYRSMLEKIAALIVPRLADWCVIAFGDGEQPVDVAAVTHANAKKMELARELQRRYPAQAQTADGLPSWLRAERAEFYPEVSEELLAHIRDPEHLRMLRELGIASAMVVPLQARGRNLGAITYAFSDGTRRYTRSDLSLAEELGRRAALAIDNARLYAEAREAIRLRDDFLSIASHELKTPLTSLRLQLQMALRSGAHNAPARPIDYYRDKFETAVRQSERLGKLIESLLDVSRLGTRPGLDVGKVNLGEMLREVARIFADTLEAAGCKLIIKAAPNLIGLWDRARIEQIINNLLSNAIKFGAGQPIEITVEKEANQACFRVRDQGIGIEPQNVARIFDRFERAVSVNNFGGLGLGLYITRRIVEAHGGTISVASEPGRGSTFTVYLPLMAPDRTVEPSSLH